MTELISKLAQHTRLWKTDVATIIATAPRRYKVYYIPKRNGGSRKIAHPSRELKCLQRALLQFSPQELLVHDCATAYEKGTSILKNASKHAGCVWLAKFDFSNFFNSINSYHWQEYLESLGIDNEFSEVSAKLFFWLEKKKNAPCMSVGAPSSPFASNRFMYSFDQKAFQYCEENEMQYSRYADDIAISAHEPIDMTVLRAAIISFLPDYASIQLNDKKTLLVGPGKRKSVTGLILSDDGKVTVGRKRKRLIEAMVHAHSLNRPCPEKEEIQGHLSFLKMVDKNGYNRIKNRFKGRSDLFTKNL